MHTIANNTTGSRKISFSGLSKSETTMKNTVMSIAILISAITSVTPANAQLPIISSLPIPGVNALPGLDTLPALSLPGTDPLAIIGFLPSIVDQNALPGTEIVPKFEAAPIDLLIVTLRQGTGSLRELTQEIDGLGSISTELLEVVDALPNVDPVLIQNEIFDVIGVLTGSETNGGLGGLPISDLDVLQSNLDIF